MDEIHRAAAAGTQKLPEDSEIPRLESHKISLKNTDYILINHAIIALYKPKFEFSLPPRIKNTSGQVVLRRSAGSMPRQAGTGIISDLTDLPNP